MHIPLTGTAIRSEADRFTRLVKEQGRDPYGIGPEAKLADGVEVRMTDVAPVDFSSTAMSFRQGVDHVVSFTALKKGSNEFIQVEVDYEYLKDGGMRREVHEQAWSGSVVMDTSLDSRGQVVAHNSKDGLSPESAAFLQDWNISY